MAESIRMIVGVDGSVRHIYSEEAMKLTERLGVPIVRRASHVEPWNELATMTQQRFLAKYPYYQVNESHWFADMLPSSGPILGPFVTRQEALDAEVAWLHEQQLPQPKS